MVWPDSPISGSWPTMRTLEAMVEAASSTSATRAKTHATTALAQNSLARLVERVSTVFQVPCWSSLAKMSPATIAVSRGSTHCEAKPRTSSAIAKPFSVANRPKSVSFGGRDWLWTMTTTAIGRDDGADQHALVRSCARSLRPSQRSAATKPALAGARCGLAGQRYASGGVHRVGADTVRVGGRASSAARARCRSA